MEINIKDVYYKGLDIEKVYYGSDLVFDRNAYDLNQNVYVFDLSKVANNYTLKLQNVNSGTQTDWGDGTIDTNLTHTYASQGTYTVKTRQLINNFNIGNYNAQNSLIKCINIDNTVTNCSYMFNGCASLTISPVINNNVTKCFYMFYGCTSLTNASTIPNNVTNCASMFAYCTNLTTIPQYNIDLMQAVKTGTNTTCTSHDLCYNNCTKITSPQSYVTLSGLYSNWF